MTRTRRTRGVGRHGHLRGGARPPEYALWKMMVQKCTNPNHEAYPRYGGRGARVCDRWLAADGYAHFLEDLGGGLRSPPRPAAPCTRPQATRGARHRSRARDVSQRLSDPRRHRR